MFNSHCWNKVIAGQLAVAITLLAVLPSMFSCCTWWSQSYVSEKRLSRRQGKSAFNGEFQVKLSTEGGDPLKVPWAHSNCQDWTAPSSHRPRGPGKGRVQGERPAPACPFYKLAVHLSWSWTKGPWEAALWPPGPSLRWVQGPVAAEPTTALTEHLSALTGTLIHIPFRNKLKYLILGFLFW